ncbi:MAG: FtsW/RodA/SpoVE family cell cycle protein, partial [Oscillospiraceae bacterium]|nr:FtsW/RodA/SpoVE family cell cycle protein [Oscillospiraceae bacterium]
VALIIIFPQFMAYTGDRVQVWLDPYSYYHEGGFQTIQALIAIGSGGIWGAGLGNSRQKYLYIPEPQNDFIFPVVCEELGFIGASIILIIFALLVARGFMIAMRCQDKFGSLLAAGCVTHIGLQVLLNIAVVTNTIPNTGISLPFFSYGGTALLMTLGEMGVVLSVSKKSSIQKI